MFSQKIDYYPEQKISVSESDYKYGLTILGETYKQIKKNNGNLNYVNYWNLAVAYMTLKEENGALVKSFLEKSLSLNIMNFSSIFIDSSKGVNIWVEYLSEDEFKKFYSIATDHLNNNINIENRNENEEFVNFQYDTNLLRCVSELSKKDQLYRENNSRNLKKQNELDIQNLKVIDSLCSKYGGYIGKSLVGERYSHVMWSIIQHSDIYSMEKYLPEIYKAVSNEELKEGALKLLIDRIYSLKYKYQIFGSQGNIPIGPNKVVKEVSRKYNISVDTAILNKVKSKTILSSDTILYHPYRKKEKVTSKFPSR